MRPLGFLSLRGISGQIAALVIASIIALHLIITITFLLHRPDQMEPPDDRRHSQLAASIQLLGAAAPAERPRLLGDIKQAFPQFDIQNLASDAAPATKDLSGGPPAPELRGLHHRLGPNYHVFPLPTDDDVHRVGIVLPDGAMLSAKLLRDQRLRPFWSGPLMSALLTAVISVSLLSLWAARAATSFGSSFNLAVAAAKNSPTACSARGQTRLAAASMIRTASSRLRPSRASTA